MSYDLYLKPRNGEFSSGSFLDYFRQRKNYSIEGQQAWYQNEDTGVYFVFELNEKDKEEISDDEVSSYPAAFNMNYFRPSVFVLEAEPELSQCIRDFDFVVSDPQVGGMGEGDYDAGQFVSGWKKGNKFGYRSILKDPETRAGIMTMPREKLQAIWKWNFR